MFGHDFGILVYALLCGGDTKFKLPKAGKSCSSTVPQPVKHRHQRMWRFYPRGHRW